MRDQLKIGLMLLMWICSVIGLQAEDLKTLISKPISLKVGLQNEIDGRLVLNETEPGMFEKGQLIISALDKEGRPLKGISFEAKDASSLNLKTQGDIRAEIDKITEDGQIIIDIKRSSSKEAATLVISDFTVTVDRVVPYGNYDLKVYGSSLGSYSNEKDNYFIIKDFIQIITPDTQTLQNKSSSNGKRTSFIAESAECMVDNENIVMSAAAYMTDNQELMVPAVDALRVLGIKENQISYAKGKLTVVPADKVIQFSKNSRAIIINGVQIDMNTVFTQKDGKSYIAVSDLGKIFGLKSEWNESTKMMVLYEK